MTERRKILKMLMAGQINIGEAEALLDACREVDDEPIVPFSKSLKEIVKARKKGNPSLNETDGRGLKIDIHEDGGEGGMYFFAVDAEELAKAFLAKLRSKEVIVPDGEELITARDILDNFQDYTHGIEINQFLYAATQIPQAKKLININIADDRARTSVLIEVTS